MAREFRNRAVRLISNQATTGASTAHAIGAASKFTVQATISGSTTATASVTLEGSLDGSNWTTIASSTLAHTVTVANTTTELLFTQMRADVTAKGSTHGLSVWAVGV